jgi:hypothetical protein
VRCWTPWRRLFPRDQGCSRCVLDTAWVKHFALNIPLKIVTSRLTADDKLAPRCVT